LLHCLAAPRWGEGAVLARRDAARDCSAQPLCADIDGFSLHAAVRVQAHDRKQQDHLCRYITRPALSDERVQVNAAGQAQGTVTRATRNGLKPGDAVQRSG